jgi:hypothetical protein
MRGNQFQLHRKGKRTMLKFRRHVEFSVGEKVWLTTSHIRPAQVANAKLKLNSRFYGPYVIKKVVSSVAYELKLPPHFKMHPVVHMSHLKEYDDGSKRFPSRPAYTAPPPPEEFSGEEHFHVEAFRNHRVRGRSGKLHWLVKWSGYGEDHNLWRPAKELQEDLTKEVYVKLKKEYEERVGKKI